MSYGLTKFGRKYLGQYLGAGDANDIVQYNSPSYHWGEATGAAIDMGIGGAGGLKVAGEVGAKELAERAAWSEL
ncbi:MAG TPA: hypothetical protein VFW40_06250, partial [Capsulimonadaceae bacterium]|nr:hypothetical protein [Capsulimonadaceae bacterium]